MYTLITHMYIAFVTTIFNYFKCIKFHGPEDTLMNDFVAIVIFDL